MRLTVRRVQPTPGSQLAIFATYSPAEMETTEWIARVAVHILLKLGVATIPVVMTVAQTPVSPTRRCESPYSVHVRRPRLRRIDGWIRKPERLAIRI